jgi:hypothetical protein
MMYPISNAMVAENHLPPQLCHCIGDLIFRTVGFPQKKADSELRNLHFKMVGVLKVQVLARPSA